LRNRTELSDGAIMGSETMGKKVNEEAGWGNPGWGKLSGDGKRYRATTKTHSGEGMNWPVSTADVASNLPAVDETVEIEKKRGGKQIFFLTKSSARGR